MMSNDITNLEGLLEQIGNNNPQLQQKLQLITALMNNNDSTSSEEKESMDKRRRFRAQKKLQRLYRENEILKERNEDLAASLGACPHCWGENSRCRTCQGKGNPGYFTIDEEGFTEYIMPVLEKLGLVKDDLTQVPETK